MPLTERPFGTYTSVEVISAPAQLEIIANIQSLLDLIPDPADQAPIAGEKSNWDLIPPALAEQLRLELTALQTATDAAPTA